MQKLNSAGAVQTFDWSVEGLDGFDAQSNEEKKLLPLEQFLSSENSTAGVWLSTDADVHALDEQVASAPAIGIAFPAFADGRGFSIAYILRAQYGFKGELVALGEFMQDQLFYLRRCGFDSYLLKENVDQAKLDSMQTSLNDFSESYQASIDQPMPLFRRK